jgi:hypothetical protein
MEPEKNNPDQHDVNLTSFRQTKIGTKIRHQILLSQRPWREENPQRIDRRARFYSLLTK